MRIKYPLLLLFSISSTVLALQKIFGDQAVWFEMDSPNEGIIRFNVSVPNNAYFAIGFGDGMEDVDMIMF